MACCSREVPSSTVKDIDTIKAVHDAYSAKANAVNDGEYASKVAAAFGYSPDQLLSIPAEANMGLSCGNPVAAASIKEGEHILDLGSGGGIDIFLAARKVGSTGQAIGLDMSKDMIALARRNAAKQGFKPPQVAFVHARLTETLPLASNSIDCVLSNCVVNLLPPEGKVALMKEVARVLKPGGRVVLDDIIAKQPLPTTVRDDLSSWVGCISGAIQLDEYKSLLADAGLQESLFVDTHGDINVYFQPDSGVSSAGCCTPSPASAGAPPKPPLPDFDANVWVASYQIYARKSPSPTESESAAPQPLLRWSDAYPAPRSTPASITPTDLAALMRSGPAGNDFVVIDVRRNDHAGGHIRGSAQWHAQTFYDTLPHFVEQYARTKRVIFYCNSSSGRGPRCAAWYQDRLDELALGGEAGSKAYILEGGVKAWLAAYGDEKDLVDRD